MLEFCSVIQKLHENGPTHTRDMKLCLDLLDSFRLAGHGLGSGLIILYLTTKISLFFSLSAFLTVPHVIYSNYVFSFERHKKSHQMYQIYVPEISSASTIIHNACEFSAIKIIVSMQGVNQKT